MEKQIGGALVAKGDYGCLFKNPTPTCLETGKPIQAEIGKIITESGNGQQTERKKTAILKDIPELSNYIIVPTQACKAAPLQPDADWNKCAIVNESSDLLVLGMRDGGQTLKQAVDRPAFFCRNFLSILEHMLEGLLLFHAAGWNHTDIHDNNIMIDKHGTPRYIDFGLAANKKNPNGEELERFTEFNPRLFFMPPEYHVYSLFIRDRDIPTAIQEIANSQQYFLLDSFFQKFNPIKPILNKLANDKTVKADPVTFYKTHGDKLDVWSLGVSFYNVFLRCIQWPSSNQIPEFVKAAPRIKTILAMMLEFNPQQRGTVKQILELVNPHNRFLRVNRLPVVATPPPFSNKIRMRRGTLKNPQKRV
jgi:serine/threonine protein kinase